MEPFGSRADALKTVFNSKKEPIVIADIIKLAEIAGRIKHEPAGQLNGIGQVIFG